MAALKFFLGKDEELEDSDDSDSDEEVGFVNMTKLDMPKISVSLLSDNM